MIFGVLHYIANKRIRYYLQKAGKQRR
jgi:hypothetical protein